MEDPHISIAEAARRIGVNKSTLSRQIKAGSIRSYDGLVRLSEVLEDRVNNLDHSMARPRKTAAQPAPAASLHQSLHPSDATMRRVATNGAATIIIDDKPMTIAEAEALRDSYRDLLREMQRAPTVTPPTSN